MKDRNKILLCLSGFGIIAIIIIIRDCSIPVWGMFEKLSFLITSKDADKTFYNIAISYAAAYIFYIIQVYVPEANREAKARKVFRLKLNKIYWDSREITEMFKTYKTEVDGKVLYSTDVVYCIEQRGQTGNKKRMQRFDLINDIIKCGNAVNNRIDEILNNPLGSCLDANLICILYEIRAIQITKLWKWHVGSTDIDFSSDIKSELQKFSGLICRLGQEVKIKDTSFVINKCDDLDLIKRYNQGYELAIIAASPDMEYCNIFWDLK